MHFDKKTFFVILSFLILIAGIPLTLYLVKQQQTLKSRANLSASRLEFVDGEGEVIKGK